MIAAETIERILRFDGGDLPVLSAYVAVEVDPGNRAPRTHAASLMHTIRPLTDDGALGHAARVSLRADIGRIEEASQQNRWKPGTMAIFACSGAGFYEEVPLPRTVRDRAVADATPFTRPMLAVLDEYHRACVVVLDRESARTWELYQGELRETGKLDDETVRKADYAGFHGLEEDGTRNRAGELAKRHFRHVAADLGSLCAAAGGDLVIVGGHRDELSAFIEILPSALRSRVAGTFTADLHTATHATVRDAAAAIVERFERDEERERVAKVLETAAEGGAAALGLERCLWAGSVAAVDLLLVQEDAMTPGVVCPEGHWLALAGATCPVCGARTRDTADVIDELVEAVIDTGGAIEHVEAETALREHTLAAGLRFPLPPTPVSDA
jgi:peptide subunit release factor 1 (eRF1)